MFIKIAAILNLKITFFLLPEFVMLVVLCSIVHLRYPNNIYLNFTLQLILDFFGVRYLQTYLDKCLSLLFV